MVERIDSASAIAPRHAMIMSNSSGDGFPHSRATAWCAALVGDKAGAHETKEGRALRTMMLMTMSTRHEMAGCVT
jgi:hypothetical protein